MGESSKIQWTDATFNPWRGCDKVSPGCANCYAEKMSHRNPKVLGEWGPGSTRSIAAESYWRQPIAWNREAERAGERRRVFCLSLGDVFEDHPDLPEQRARLGKLILETPNLDWLLLTKRPERWRQATSEMWVRFVPEAPLPPNVWLGTSVEDQTRADERIPHLLQVQAAVRFLSMEPLLGPVTLDISKWGRCFHEGHAGRDHLADHRDCACHLDWVIVGGESGPGARPCEVSWVRSIVEQCQESRVAVFVKQLGARPAGCSIAGCEGECEDSAPIRLRDHKGGDWSEWPEDLRIRELPRGASGAP